LEVLDTFGIDISTLDSQLQTRDDFSAHIDKEKNSILDYKQGSLPEGVFENFQKVMIFTTIDQKWRQHLYSMDQLRGGIQLRAYGQKNPLIEYKKEGFSMFREMMFDTNKETIKKVFRTNLVKTEDSSIGSSASIPTNLKSTKENTPELGFVAPPSTSNQPANTNFGKASPQSREPIVNDRKIGRNEKVTIVRGDETKIIKWKKAQDLISSEGWALKE
jgi:preprotein translocase subunit SecA